MSKKFNRTLGSSTTPSKFSEPYKPDENQFNNNCVNCRKHVKVVSPIDTAIEKREKNVLCADCYNLARQQGQIPVVDHQKERAKVRAKQRKQNK